MQTLAIVRSHREWFPPIGECQNVDQTLNHDGNILLPRSHQPGFFVVDFFTRHRHPKNLNVKLRPASFPRGCSQAKTQPTPCSVVGLDVTAPEATVKKESLDDWCFLPAPRSCREGLPAKIRPLEISQYNHFVAQMNCLWSKLLLLS